MSEISLATGLDVYIDPPAKPAFITVPTNQNLVVPVVGPTGPIGPIGLPGEDGTDGRDGTDGINGAGSYYATYNFATPSEVWAIQHDQGSTAFVVELFDTSGGLIEAAVRYVDSNRIEVDWYYPTAGEARLFR